MVHVSAGLPARRWTVISDIACVAGNISTCKAPEGARGCEAAEAGHLQNFGLVACDGISLGLLVCRFRSILVTAQDGACSEDTHS